MSDPNVSSDVLSSSGNITHISGDGVDQGAHEVVRINSNYEMSRSHSPALPRGSSPIGLKLRTYDEQNIEIMKADSKDESSPSFGCHDKGIYNEFA
jgi:hypothetical protein